MARPREFDRQEVLAKATVLFWEKGFAETTLDELDRATGLHRGSIYNAFGDKRQLYLDCLDFYGEREMAAAAALLAGAPAPKATRQLFGGLVNAVVKHGRRRGCLLCNASVDEAPYDRDVEARVLAHIGTLRRAFSQSLSAHRRPGTSAERVALRRLADHLTASYMGLWVLAKAGFPEQVLRNVVASVISGVDEI
jgi:TetR/AcrR family transcriptional repressor of nem operon